MFRCKKCGRKLVVEQYHQIMMLPPDLKSDEDYKDIFKTNFWCDRCGMSRVVDGLPISEEEAYKIYLNQLEG